ncbi:hypothetical protein [Natronorubrum bangense]|uniref:Uncharacterized protein n=2 Tax=Natronorubrum bangense TaxID=61858 RepID=L9WL62_9EURY|nr:hypothetical protein [Natronorubrum bangense]ELY50240.1 hypothetical protein C494_05513 [Natronorubrum bangense JCM 10635]QCC54314.1 hypothetical protein DV706_07320 [Natronorubrum bangense]
MDARDAIAVLFDQEVLKLITIALVGWWLLTTSATGWGGYPAPLQFLYDGLVTLTWLTGTVTYYGGVLALLVKLVYEASRRANSS